MGDPSPALRMLAARMLSLASPVVPAWPADPALAERSDLDREAVLRSLRAGHGRFGTMALDLPTAGDGRTTATFDLAVERGGRTLVVGVELQSGTVTAVALRVRERAAPPWSW